MKKKYEDSLTDSPSPLSRAKQMKAAKSVSSLATKTNSKESTNIGQSTSLTSLKPTETVMPSNNISTDKVLFYNNQIVSEDDVVASIMLDDPNAFDRCCFDQNLFENLIQTPLKQDRTSTNNTPLKSNSLMLNCNNAESAADTNISMIMNSKIRTPTPLKNAMAKIKLKEEQRERLRIKSLALNTEFCDSGYLSFNENINSNNMVSVENLMPPNVINKNLMINVNNPILIGKTNDQLNLTEKARTIINGSQFNFSFNCTSTPVNNIGINANCNKL